MKSLFNIIKYSHIKVGLMVTVVVIKSDLWKEKNTYKKSEKHTIGHAQKIRIVHVLTYNM